MSRLSDQSIWRNRDYLLLWSGQMVSVLGSGVSGLTVPLLVLALTHSPAQAGFVSATFGLPYAVFALPAGALIDRWNRKRVMMICTAVNVLAMASITLALFMGNLTMPQIYIVAFILGTAFVFFNVAEIAALTTIVTREQLPFATAQNQATFSVGNLIGPPIGGFLFQISRALPFLADTVSYVVSFLTLVAIKTPFQAERVETPRTLRVEIWEGLLWLWNQRTVRTLTLLTAGWNVCSGGFILIIILLAKDHGAPPSLIGEMFAIASVGSIIGALIAPRMQRRFRIGPLVIGILWFNALIYPLYLAAPNVVVIALINAIAFLVGPTYNVVVISYRLNLIPEELQGRVNSSVRMLALSANPLGAALSGALLQSVGITATVWTISAGLALFAILATVSHSVRHAPPISQGAAA